MTWFRPFGDALVCTRTHPSSVTRRGATGRGQVHACIDGDEVRVERSFWFDVQAGSWVDVEERISGSLAELAGDAGPVAESLGRWFGPEVRAEAVQLAAERVLKG